MKMATRTPKEVFEHHVGALESGDIDGVLADYSDGAVVITPGGAVRGKNGIREGVTKLLSGIPGASWQLKRQIYEGDLLLVEYAVDAPIAKIDDGVDTFCFRDGLIHAQTVHFALQKK
jgi:ketosteroid isomerase-like protein